MKRIKIPVDLRDYIERLQYEAVRYGDLLKTVNRDCCPMTEAEWDSSLTHYRNLYDEALICLNAAKEQVAEIYKDEIAGQVWHISFSDCDLVVGSMCSDPVTPRDEQYAETLRRLFPRKTSGEALKINDSYTKDITLQVTDACNMACTYCYQHNKGNHSMSFDVAKRVIDMILDADERTNTYITSTKTEGATISFIGGEPWLEVDLIARVSDYFIGELFRRKHPWAIKFSFSVCSNGLLHFDERVQAYMRRHKDHMGYNISIDGNKELHDSCRIDKAGNGTYDRAIAGVKDYRETFGGRMGSKMTIAPENVDKIFDAVSHMIGESGYRQINLNCVYEEGWTDEHAGTLYWQLHRLTDWLFDRGLQDSVSLSILTEMCGKPLDRTDDRNWCGGVGLMVAADYKGDFFPCLRYMESSLNGNAPEYIIGDIEAGINVRPEHRCRVDCLSCITRRSQSTDECFDCPIAMGCGWCSGHNYETFGTPDRRATYICCMHKARVLANVYYWRRRGVDFPMNCPREWAVRIIGEEEFEKLSSMEVMTNGDGIR